MNSSTSLRASSNSDERLAYLGFSVFSGIGPVKFGELLTYFKSAKAAWESSEKNLTKVLGPKTLADFLKFRNTFSPQEYAEKLEKQHVSFLPINDPLYPQLLKQIPKPPFVLYVRGNVEVLGSTRHSGEDSERSVEDDSRIPKRSWTSPSASSGLCQDDGVTIAVVGSRKVTSYGRDVTEMFVRTLVLSGTIIVSGLAMGVDSVAHRTTIEMGGKTIAVLGCGVDCCSPAENISLYDQILESGGAIVSELPLGHPPNKGSFPARNRIIAGLSQAVLVTEGAEDSGSLITAEFGFEFNRPVFAVPGQITSAMSKGPYQLIRKGATQVVGAEDIINELGIMNHELRKGKKKPVGQTKEEEIILELLENEAMSFDEIVRRSKLNPSQVGSILSLLEISGLISKKDAGLFTISS